MTTVPGLSADPPSSVTSCVVSSRKLLYTASMDGPVMSFTTLCTLCLDEALVLTQVVAHVVPPGTVLLWVLWELVHDVLVYVCQDHLLFRTTQNGLKQNIWNIKY